MLGKLYAVLSDKEQRAVYDEQGVVDEESDVLKQDRCWEDYWRLLFPKVTEHRMTLLFNSSLVWLTSESHWLLFVCQCGQIRYTCNCRLMLIYFSCLCNINTLVFTTCRTPADHSAGHPWIREDVQGLRRGATGCDQTVRAARGQHGCHHRLSSLLFPRRRAQVVQHHPGCHRWWRCNSLPGFYSWEWEEEKGPEEEGERCVGVKSQPTCVCSCTIVRWPKMLIKL